MITMSMVTTGTDRNSEGSRGLPPLPEGLRWSVFTDSYGDLAIALEEEKRILGFPRWKRLYKEEVTSYYDRYQGGDTDELKRRTVKLAEELMERYNKTRSLVDAKKAVEETFKGVSK